MSIMADMKLFARLAWGLRGFLHHKFTLEQAQEIVQRRLAERNENFLRLLERGVFGYPRSPYLPLLKLAGCELGDIKNMVQKNGLEHTLRQLREAGVYITFEEFKGREPVVRGGQTIPIESHDFDNPYLNRYYQIETGGSTGVGGRVMVDLDYLASRGPQLMLSDHAHGIINVPTVIWFGILPSIGVNVILSRAYYNQPAIKWFSSREMRISYKHWLATQCIVGLGHLYGVPLPWPVRLGNDQVLVIARWVAKTLKAHGSCLIQCSVSKALRVCIAASEEGLDLTGATFSAGGEPPTTAKVEGITRTGARYLSHYYSVEAGLMGMGCAFPADANDQHFFKDHLALIQYPRLVPGSSITVQAFNLTTLLPTAPKLLLNVEIDDYGVVSDRHCGCPLETYGFTDHLRHIRSFRKLTGEGVTLVGSEMVQILEEVLPARFGGSPLDYQLLEEEDQLGFTRLSLIVSPKIEIVNEALVIETLLESLKRSSAEADMAQAVWRQVGTLRVRRMEPIWTNRGKLMPLHLAQRSEA